MCNDLILVYVYVKVFVGDSFVGYVGLCARLKQIMPGKTLVKPKYIRKLIYI